MTPRKRNVPRPDMSGAAPFKIDGVYCLIIPLTQGQWTIIWQSDYEWLSAMTWGGVWSKKKFYAVHSYREGGKSKALYMHKAIAGKMYGHGMGDHKSSVSLDNRRDNIRPANASQNSMNRAKPSTNTTGLKCAFRSGNRFRSRIGISGKRINLGSFETAEEAHAAYREAAKKYFGEFARFE